MSDSLIKDRGVNINKSDGYRQIFDQEVYSENEIDEIVERAICEKQFEIYFQPQYNQSDFTLYGAEALVRWNHPEKGMISPGVFIPLFEEYGIIAKLDRYVLSEVCRYQRKWADSGIQIVPVSVNISRLDVLDEHIFENIMRCLEFNQLTTADINIEITESAYIDEPKKMTKLVERLRNEGFKVEMDDFGSGYSSLNTLKDMQVDILKLDMKFIDKQVNNGRSGRILSSIVRMAHWLEMPVIAEGVETKDQAEFLKSIGCLYIQGYYLDKPLPAHEFVNRLQNYKTDIMRNHQFTRKIDTGMDFLASSEYTKILLDNAMGAAGIIEYDGNHVNVLRLNSNFYEMIDTSFEEYNQYLFDLRNRFDTENWNIYETAVKKAIETMKESVCDTQSKPIGNKKAPFWMRTKFKYLGEYNGVSILFTSIENIEHQKLIEKKNFELYSDLDSIMDSIPGGVLKLEYTDHFEITYVSETTATQFGFSYEEYLDLISEDIFAGIHPDDREDVIENIKLSVRLKLNQFDKKYRHICKDGTYKWVRIAYKLNKEIDGVAYGSAILINTVAPSGMDSKKYQEELEKRAGKYKLEYNEKMNHMMEEQSKIISQIGGAYFKYSELEDRMYYISTSLYDMLGYTKHEFEKKFHNRFANLVCSEDREAVFHKIQQDIREAGEFRNCEYRIETKSGELKNVQAIGKKIVNSDGKIWYLISLFDRDREKKLEEELEHQKILNRMNEQILNGGMTTYQIKGNRWTIDAISDNYLELLGYSKEQIMQLTKNDILVLVHPDERERIRQIAIDALKNKKTYTVQYRTLCSDGEYKLLASTGRFVERENKTYLYFTSMDITNFTYEEG